MQFIEFVLINNIVLWKKNMYGIVKKNKLDFEISKEWILQEIIYNT